MTSHSERSPIRRAKGLTLIEIIIALVIVSILVMMAVPSYQTHMLRVYRGEAIAQLLKTALCQERIHASTGLYDTGLCIQADSQSRYSLAYTDPDVQGQRFTVVASPLGSQQADACGSLSLDQSGYRDISSEELSVNRCWSGR